MTIATPEWLRQRIASKSRRHGLLRRDLWAFVALLWLPAVVLATPLGADVDVLLAIPPTLAVMTVLLSTLSGATALATRIDRELSAAPDKPLKRLWLTCIANMLGSWLAGSLGFVLAQAQHMDVWLGLGLVIAASFTGAKFIEGITERYMVRALPDVLPSSPKES